MKPDITAPGTHIEGAASQHPMFDSTGVCGPDSVELYFPKGQTLYTWSSGTSHSTPQVAGVVVGHVPDPVGRRADPRSYLGGRVAAGVQRT